MKCPGLSLAAVLAATAFGAVADEQSRWRTTWDGTLYAYASQTVLRDNSVLNPDNRIARMDERSATAELRLNLKAENDRLRLTARPIMLRRESRSDIDGEHDTTHVGEAYLSQWQLRARAAEGWHVAVGRDALNWGPAQFRSPSSPYYFDNGRHDPMRELVGMDSAKVTWTPDLRTSASLVRVVRSGFGAPSPDVWRNSWLFKFDQRGDAWAYGLAAAKAPDLGAFYGIHAQTTLSDALMFYGEAGSSERANALQSPSDAMRPFSVDPVSKRRSTALIGGAYTFEGGQSLTAEYLHDGHGYTRAEEDAYFRRAEVLPGMALGLSPRLLGRDYVHFVWQTNLMDERGHWRLMYTRNLSDRSNEFAFYGETVLSGRVTAFLMAMAPTGRSAAEFSSLIDRRVTLGLKIALP